MVVMGLESTNTRPLPGSITVLVLAGVTVSDIGMLWLAPPPVAERLRMYVKIYAWLKLIK